MSGYHAKLSPSSSSRWTVCTASVAAQEGRENSSSDASRTGTCGHQMHAELLLDTAIDPQSYLGKEMAWFGGKEYWSEALPPNDTAPEYTVSVTQELIDGVMTSVNFVRDTVVLQGGELLVEQSVPIGHITGEKDATGSADVILLSQNTLFVKDLKLGRHKVHAYDILVPAYIDNNGNAVSEVRRANLQMAMYALGALEAHGLMYDFTHVTMTILQPMVGHVSEYTCTIQELLELGEYLSSRAIEVRTEPKYVPTPDGCHFCRASGDCQAQTQMVLETALTGFENVDTALPVVAQTNALGSLYAILPMIRNWCDSIEAQTRQALLDETPVVRNDGLSYKMVEGKNAARKWADEEAAEALLKKAKLTKDELYSVSLISPTATEKLAATKKPKKGEEPTPPRLAKSVWDKLQAHITQGQKGAPLIALETDPRPAIASATEGFGDVTADDGGIDDLFN